MTIKFARQKDWEFCVDTAGTLLESIRLSNAPFRVAEFRDGLEL